MISSAFTTISARVQPSATTSPAYAWPKSLLRRALQHQQKATGLFDSVDVQYLRRFWCGIYCAARGIELNIPSSERTVGEYYVAGDTNGKRFLTPLSGPNNQRQFAASLREDQSVKKLSSIRLPEDVILNRRATEPDWQTRMAQALARVVPK
jgi:hypothetical protein